MRLICILSCLLGCSRSGTGVILDLEGAGSIDRLEVVGVWNGTPHHSTDSAPRAPVGLPAQVLVMMPDASLSARFDVTGSLAGQIVGEGSSSEVPVRPNQIVHATVTLAPPGSDLSQPADLTSASDGPTDGPPPDLSVAPPPDLTGADLAGADLTVVDLKPLPDLRPACVGPRCPYAYRRRITIANPSSTLPVGYTVRVPLPSLTGKVRGDFNDLRIFEDSPNQERDRIVDSAPPGQSPAVWLALGATIAGAGSDNGYWLYYGDPAAAAGPQNGSNVFAFYDDFPGTTLNARWTTNGAGPSVAGGLLTLHQNGTEAVRSDYPNDKVLVQSALEMRVAVSNANSAGTAPTGNTYWYWFGFQRQNDFTTTDPWILWIARGPNIVAAERSVNPGNCYPSACTSSNQAQNNAFHWYRIERLAVSTAYFYDGASAGTPFADNNGSSDDYSIMIRNFAATSDLTVDWVRARGLANPEPNVTVGAEEMLH